MVGGGVEERNAFYVLIFHGHFPALRSQEESLWITFDNVFLVAYSVHYSITHVENKQDRQARSLIKFWL